MLWHPPPHLLLLFGDLVWWRVLPRARGSDRRFLHANREPGPTGTDTTRAATTQHLRGVAHHLVAEGGRSSSPGDTEVRALDGVGVEFARHEFTAIMGPSGSGKSTLMHVMACLDEASGGSTYIDDTDLWQLSDKDRTALRRDRLGFIFQSFNLVPTLTAAENISLPTNIAGGKVDPDWFEEVTRRLGLTERLSHRPAELSGGQQQRVACARALVSRPELIFGDELTGNLDSNVSREVLEILRTAVDQGGQTVVIVTHDARAASYADRVVFLRDGNIVDQMRDPDMDSIRRVMVGREG